jgi:hypothetical protein
MPESTSPLASTGEFQGAELGRFLCSAADEYPNCVKSVPVVWGDVVAVDGVIIAMSIDDSNGY